MNIALLTSGGDAPGMNTAIYYLYKYSLLKNIKLYGVRRGFKGLIKNDIFELSNTSNDIINRGGSILYSSRSESFRDIENRIKAAQNLSNLNINHLIVLGGNGSLKGAHLLSKEHKINVVCIPATIDNDISSIRYSLGFDTALNNILKAVSKIDDTAESHDNIFIVELMGKNSGNLVFNSFIAGAGHTIVIPEYTYRIENIIDTIESRRKKDLSHNIILFSEGVGSPKTLAKEIHRSLRIVPKIVTLGHIQRGGSPTAFERIIAEKFAYNALNLIAENSDVVIDVSGDEVIVVPLTKIWVKDNKITEKKYEDLIKISKM